MARIFANLEPLVYSPPAAAQRQSTVARRGRYRRDSACADALLVRRLKAGDADALETVFNTYSKKLYAVALRMIGAAADAEEVIQDVFWTVFRKIHSFQGKARFSTWLYRLTVNAALGKIRRRKRHRELACEALHKFREGGGPAADWADTLDEKYARIQMQRLLGRALEQLQPIDKTVVVLSDLEGMSDQEIAAAVGLTVSAVKSRLHRARVLLRERLLQARPLTARLAGDRRAVELDID